MNSTESFEDYWQRTLATRKRSAYKVWRLNKKLREIEEAKNKK